MGKGQGTKFGHFPNVTRNKISCDPTSMVVTTVIVISRSLSDREHQPQKAHILEKFQVPSMLEKVEGS